MYPESNPVRLRGFKTPHQERGSGSEGLLCPLSSGRLYHAGDSRGQSRAARRITLRPPELGDQSWETLNFGPEEAETFQDNPAEDIGL